MATGTTDAHHRDVVLDADLGERIRDLLIQGSRVLGREFPVRDLSRARGAGQVLRYLWDATIADLGHVTRDPEQSGRLGTLTTLLTHIREAEGEIERARLTEGTELLRRVRRALAHLGDARSADDLLGRAPEVLCTLGFDRALVSTVHDSVWQLHTMCVVGDQRWAEDIVAAGRSNPPRLDGTIVESDVVEHGRGGLVYDVQHNPRVDRPLVRMCRSTSYGIAPLTLQDSVVGLVHGDCYRPHREVDDTDRAVLDLFAVGLSQTLARLRVLDGLATLRSGLDNLTGDANVLARQTIPAPVPTHPLLSAREAEVIELLAAGEPNRLIARTLCISEGTVKTHVTHILRKLGAANRAEAVAYWLRNVPARCGH